jgi:hypothetical protein
LFSLFMFRHLYTRTSDPVQAAWLRLCAKLAKAGLPRAAHEGAMDYATRIAVARPKLAETMLDVAGRYMSLRYGETRDEASLRAFRNAVRAFKL